MKVFVLFLFFALSANVDGQTVRRATLLEHRSYVLEVLEKTVHGIEDYQWCNLKIPDMTEEVKYELFGRELAGTVTFKNGYVLKVQHVDVTEASIQQVWSWATAAQVGTVDVRALLRLHDVVYGFDVEAKLNGETYVFTSTFTHRLLNFNFSILKNMATNEITVTVVGAQPATLATNLMSFIPHTDISDLIGTTFVPASTQPVVISWGRDIIQPIVDDVVRNKVEFPEVCYNC
ncbi:uncharacterized protein LOC114358842 [Ostrinia furnacalis]|uniref:uncharacterized protein LOC114358842 n=1 Tax=Ostrinia furnacalis TaxID=93504 RepID=UPI00103D9654|nr:uncharacterized protein LOC114358842 [Ostrinia furnacalis]